MVKNYGQFAQNPVELNSYREVVTNMLGYGILHKNVCYWPQNHSLKKLEQLIGLRMVNLLFVLI